MKENQQKQFSQKRSLIQIKWMFFQQEDIKRTHWEGMSIYTARAPV